MSTKCDDYKQYTVLVRSTYTALVELNFSVCEVRHLLKRVDRDQHRPDVTLAHDEVKDGNATKIS